MDWVTVYPTAACPKFHIGCRLGRELFTLPVCCCRCPWSHGLRPKKLNLTCRPRGKESTEVRISQNKGKESENSYQKLKRSLKDRHTETVSRYFDRHGRLYQSEESKCLWTHNKDGVMLLVVWHQLLSGSLPNGCLSRVLLRLDQEHFTLRSNNFSTKHFEFLSNL